MQWTSVERAMALDRLLTTACVAVLTAVSMVANGACPPGDSLRVEAVVEEGGGRPFLWAEVMPLSGVERPILEGLSGWNGAVPLAWPADGVFRVYRLRSDGSTWTLPLGLEVLDSVSFMLAPPGRAPFADRPGELRMKAAECTSLDLLAAVERDIQTATAGAAAEWQQSLLWGESVGRREAEVFGGRIGDRGEASVDENRNAAAELDTLAAALGDSGDALDEVLQAMVWSARLGLPGAPLEALRREWQAPPAPVTWAEARRFEAGLDVFASTNAWAEEDLQRHRRALREGNWDELVQTTSMWWGAPDADKTAVWLLMRLSDDGFGVRRPAQPFQERAWPEGLSRLMDRLEAHEGVALEMKRLRASWAVQDKVPDSLHVFTPGEDRVTVKEQVGDGPAMWLWLDASSPSTTVQLSVLERMMAAPDARKWPRDLTWVVADAGRDWDAFQRLYRQLVDRYGGLSRMPFTLVHTGADHRWVKAFDLSTLPAMRHHGPDFQLTPRDMPLPGPALSRWLAKRP